MKTKKNTPDIEVWGNQDTFLTLTKTHYKKDRLIKTTKAMQIDGIGCVVQVTTQQLNDTGMLPMLANGGLALDAETIKTSVIAEALTFVPGAFISEAKDKDGKVISRKLLQF